MKKIFSATFILAITLSLSAAASVISSPAGPNSPSAPAEAWEQVASGGVDSVNNTTIIAIKTFGTYLYAGTWNPIDGASILRSPDGETWNQVASAGFTDVNNWGIYGLAEYNSNLYVGTRNDWGQAELWYSASGDPGSWVEVPNTGLGANQVAYWSLQTHQNELWAGCATPGATAELWSYNSATTNWTQAAIPGFSANNAGIYSMAEFNGDLYIGTDNFTTGAEVWRRDGTTLGWEKVAQNGFGNLNNRIVYTMRVYKDVLYVGTFNGSTGAELYATSDGNSWNLVFDQGFDDPNNIALWNMVESDGYFYLATQNNVLGGRVYRTTDGRAWTPVSLGGFGDTNNTRVWGMAVFEGLNGLHLYAGTENANGADIWRTALPQPEESWEQVEQAGFDNDASNRGILDYVEFDGALYAAVANLNGTQVWRSSEGRTWTQVGSDGFGDVNNVGGYAFTVHNNQLYLGTENANGAAVYRLNEGIAAKWEQVNTAGFGDAANNRAVYALASYNSNLYAGVWNFADRAEVWRYSGTGTTWSNVSPPDGTFEASNDYIRSMAVYTSTAGTHLYIGTHNSTGGEIWRYDGSAWTALNTDGQSDSNNTSLLVLTPFDGYLYAGYQNITGAEVWRSADGNTWTQVNQGGFGRNLVDDPINYAVFAMAEWDGYLYAGTAAFTGGEVWRTAVGASQSDWEQANTDGFSFQQNTVILALEPFGPHLYAGTNNFSAGAEVWRTGRPDTGPSDPCCEVVKVGIEVEGASWIRVNGTDTVPIRAPNAGIYDVPLKGAGVYNITVEYGEGNQGRVQPITVVVGSDGTVQITHGTPTQMMSLLAPTAPDEAWTQVAEAAEIGASNTAVVSMRQFGSYLYAGTLNSANGAVILRSPDGDTWNAVSTGGLGDAANVGILGLIEYAGSLYAGTNRTAGQAEMWRSATGNPGTWTTEVVNSGLGALQTSYWSMLVYNDPIVGRDLLWAGCDVNSNNATAELWKYDSTTTNWTQDIIPGFDVDMNGDTFGDNAGIYAMAAFQGDLYIGTKNFATGAEVWRRDGSDGSWTKVAQNGIGSPINTMIFDMEMYNGVLYVGTLNFTGAELYATRDGDSWETVFTAGLDNPANIAIWQLIESNGYLYLGTQNAAGGRVYRTVDGNAWTPASTFGFGDATNTIVWGMATFDGLGGTYLYAGTNKGAGAEIWRSIVPQPQESWEQVERAGIDDDANNSRIGSMVEHDGAIYVSTHNGAGGQVWKSVDGRTWVQVGLDGLDSNPVNAANNDHIYSLAVHNGGLYAGVDSSGSGARVYLWNETSATWAQVNADGFGTVNNESALAMTSFGGSLYASTYNATERAKVFMYTGSGSSWTNVSPPDGSFELANSWSDAMTVYTSTAGSHLYIGTENNTGGEIWRYDGSTWASVTTDGFGDANNDEVMAFQSFDGYLYAGFANGTAGGEVWRSQTGASGAWSQVNQNGFGRNLVNDPNNEVINSFGVWNGYLYAGTTNGTTGGEVWRTSTGAVQADWEQVNTDGFGWDSNDLIMTLLGFGDHIYAGTKNNTLGAEIWRSGLPGVPGGRFAQVINVSLRTDQACSIDVSGAATWSHQAPARGVYAIPMSTSGIYNIACDCGESLSVYVDTAMGPQLDHFTFNTIANQVVDVPFAITINAMDDSAPSGAIAVTATVTLADSTGTISPTQAVFAGQNSKTLDVTIGVTATDVIITATYNAITGTSNAFDVTVVPPGPQLDHFSFNTVTDQVIGELFPVTINAIDDGGSAIVISYTLALTDSTGSISPTQAVFAGQSSKMLNVTIGVTATDVVITATYNTITGTSNAFDVTDVPVGPRLDHFTFSNIADQGMGAPFSITINAIDDGGSPIAITHTVALTDSTGTISPIQAVFANQSAKTLDVTIGVTATDVVITATYNLITGVSNAFDVTTEVEYLVYLPLVIKQP